MMPVSSSRQLAVLLRSNNDYMRNGALVSLLFQLLRQEDLYMSMAWHSIWHGSERIPSPTPC